MSFSSVRLPASGNTTRRWLTGRTADRRGEAGLLADGNWNINVLLVCVCAALFASSSSASSFEFRRDENDGRQDTRAWPKSACSGTTSCQQSHHPFGRKEARHLRRCGSGRRFWSIASHRAGLRRVGWVSVDWLPCAAPSITSYVFHVSPGIDGDRDPPWLVSLPTPSAPAYFFLCPSVFCHDGILGPQTRAFPLHTSGRVVFVGWLILTENSPDEYGGVRWVCEGEKEGRG